MENSPNTSGAMHIANILSVFTLLICCVSKIPQIRTIVKHKSAKGLSVLSVCLEVFRYAIMWMYNYCFGYSLLSYIEYPLLLLQQSVLMYFVFKYNNLLCTEIILFGLLLLITVILFLMETLPKELLVWLIPLCTPIGATSRIVQLIEIVRTKRADNVNITTWCLTSFCGFAKTYRILIESRDKLLLSNSISSSLTGCSVLIAAIYYKKKIIKPK